MTRSPFARILGATLVALLGIASCTERPGPTAVRAGSGPSFDFSNNLDLLPQGNCQRIEGTMNLTFTGVWSGTTDFVIGGEALHADVSFQTNAAKRTESGLLVGSETGTFDFGDGYTLTEQDHFSFGPSSIVGVWRFNALGRVVGGTGRFNGASGELIMQGTALFSVTGVTAAVAFKGPICEGGAY